jgi:hypothetical protein
MPPCLFMQSRDEKITYIPKHSLNRHLNDTPSRCAEFCKNVGLVLPIPHLPYKPLHPVFCKVKNFTVILEEALLIFLHGIFPSASTPCGNDNLLFFFAVPED